MTTNDVYKHNTSYDAFQDSIVSVLDENLKKSIANSPFIGLMADETSDICVNKKLIVYVKVIEKGYTVTKFVRNCKVMDGKAETIFNKITNICNELGIDHQKIAGFGSDGAAVMLGNNSGVGVRMQSINKCIIVVHCVAHRLALASAGAAKSVPYLGKFQKILNSIYAFFSCSPVRYEKLRALFRELHIEIKKLKHQSSARWLSLLNALKAVLQDYVPLVLNFDNISNTQSKEDLEGKKKATYLWKFTRNVKCLLTVALLIDALEVVTKLSKQFQSDELNLGKLKPSVQASIDSLEVMKNIDGPNLLSVKSKITSDTLTGVIMYKGAQLYDTPSKQAEFQNLRQKYLSKLIENIKERFPNNSLDLLTCLDITLNPQRIPSNINPEELANHGKSEILVLMDFFAQNQTLGIKKEECLQNFLQFKMLINNYKSLKMKDFCRIVIVEYADEFPEYAKIAAFALAIPVSSVPCERGFSAQKRIQSRLRSRLLLPKVEKIMKISLSGPPINEFDFDAALDIFNRQDRRTPNS